MLKLKLQNELYLCVLTSKIARHRKSILHAGSVSYPRFFSSKHCDTTIAISAKALLANSQSASMRKNRKYIMLLSFGHFLIWLTKPCAVFFWHEKLRPSLKNESKKAGQRQLLQPFAMGSHYEKKLTKNIRPTDILLVFSKCSQIY